MTDLSAIYSVSASDDCRITETAARIKNATAEQLSDITFGRYTPTVPLVMTIRKDEGTQVFSAAYILAQRFFDALQDCKATGWGHVPVDTSEVEYLREPFGALVIKGRTGPEDMHRCRPATALPEYGNANLIRIGSPITLDAWDGSDLFFAGEKHALYVTQRVKDALEKRFSIFKFQPTETEIHTYWYDCHEDPMGVRGADAARRTWQQAHR